METIQIHWKWPNGAFKVISKNALIMQVTEMTSFNRLYNEGSSCCRLQIYDENGEGKQKEQEIRALFKSITDATISKIEWIKTPELSEKHYVGTINLELASKATWSEAEFFFEVAGQILTTLGLTGKELRRRLSSFEIQRWKWHFIGDSWQEEEAIIREKFGLTQK